MLASVGSVSDGNGSGGIYVLAEATSKYQPAKRAFAKFGNGVPQIFLSTLPALGDASRHTAPPLGNWDFIRCSRWNQMILSSDYESRARVGSTERLLSK